MDKIARSEMMHWLLHVVWLHALCVQHSPYCMQRPVTSFNTSPNSTRTTLYHLNIVFFFVDIVINFTLDCHANAENYTRISQCMVNSCKHSSGWYYTVWTTSLVLSCGMNCIAVTKSVHMNHIFILCSWKCKWFLERNRYSDTKSAYWTTCTVQYVGVTRKMWKCHLWACIFIASPARLFKVA
jgi:hypothetical protein